MQRLVYRRVDETLKQKGSGFSGKGQYGECRGRDRLVMVWLNEASSLVEEMTNNKGGTIFFFLVLAQDVEDVFPQCGQKEQIGY